MLTDPTVIKGPMTVWPFELNLPQMLFPLSEINFYDPTGHLQKILC